ncbi:MAG: hypothetical protein ACKPKO_21165, partial [Candidatus Fonsibacter sp.]
QKGATNVNKRIPYAQRKQRKLAMTDQHVPWSKFKGKQASVDIEARVGGDFPVVSGHMAQQGIEVLGRDDWAQADVCVVSYLRKDKLRDKFLWRTNLGNVLVVEHHRGHG